jgi:hypothetical protein
MKSKPIPMTAEWRPDPEKQALIAAQFPGINFDLELRHFRAWWMARSINRADWDRCWLNWVKRAHLYNDPTPVKRPSLIRAALEKMP